MASYDFDLQMEELSIRSTKAEPIINWSTWVKPLEGFYEPNTQRRSRCEGDSNAYDAFWKTRHAWDLVDYHLYLIFVEKKCPECGVRLSNSWLVESDSSRWDNFGYAIDSDDRDCQSGWKDPLVIFASLPIPHPTHFDDRRIVLGFNLRTHCLVGFLFKIAPENIAELGSAWHRREPIINMTLKRFLDILRYSTSENQDILGKGIFNYFRESTRRFHVGMDAIIAIKYIQFLRDALEGARLSAPCRVGEFPPNFFDMEEVLRDFLCRCSQRGWMSFHTGMTAEQIRSDALARAPSSDNYIDQLFPPEIVNDEKKTAMRGSRHPVQQEMSSLMSCEVNLLQMGSTTLESVRQSTSDVVILLGIFCIECLSLAKNEKDCQIAWLVEMIIQRRMNVQPKGWSFEAWKWVY